MVNKKKPSTVQGLLFPITEDANTHDKAVTPRAQTTSKIHAIVKPEMLLWGRQYAYLSVMDAARRIGISEDKLQDWESGVSSPTINQLHTLAKVYRQPFAVFYLPSPPKPTSLPVKDFRRLPSTGLSSISYELANEIHTAINRREIAIQLLEDADDELTEFPYSASISEPPNVVAERVHSLIFSDPFSIPSFREKRIAFNYFRKKLEDIGILVFQTTEVATGEMRGFSIGERIKPVIVVNRKDAYAGRIFSLFHELTHILLRTSSLCDLEPEYSLPPEEQWIEVFCNEVAAEILMPKDVFLGAYSKQMKQEIYSSISDQGVSNLSDIFGVSREAIVRRLLTLGIVPKDFYQQKREQYLQDLLVVKKERKKGRGLSRPQDIISKAGKPYVRLIFSSLDANRITVNDASGFLNVRISQMQKTGRLAGVYS
jgi:Zn-dependent peptidase ImmA (M78 family)/DNA-binding transcriptional regulator YiaG